MISEAPSARPTSSNRRRSPLTQSLLLVAHSIRGGLVSPELAADALRVLTGISGSQIDIRQFLATAGQLSSGALLPLEERVERMLERFPSEGALLAEDSRVEEQLLGFTPSARAERFQDLKFLGHGGMGLVYDTFDPDLSRRVALKFLRIDDGMLGIDQPPVAPMDLRPGRGGVHTEARRHQAAKRFLREAQITGRIQHPGVLPVYEVGLTRHGVPYYAMQLLRSRRTLADLLDQPAMENHSERIRLIRVMICVCDAVEHAHARGIVHRDLTPRNIGLVDDDRPYVLDWGLAKVLGGDVPEVLEPEWATGLCILETQVGALGTPGYMAPEAATGRIDDVGQRSDVFSLGAILYRVLLGRSPHPFASAAEYVESVTTRDPPRPADVRVTIQGVLSQIVMKALSRDPSERYASAGELGLALRTWLQYRDLSVQVEGWLRAARNALNSAKRLHGQARLKAVVRGLVPVSRILTQNPSNPGAKGFAVEFADLREQALSEMDKARRQLRLVRVGGVVLGLVLLAGLLLGHLYGTVIQARDRAQMSALIADVALKEAHKANDEGRRATFALLATFTRMVLGGTGTADDAPAASLQLLEELATTLEAVHTAKDARDAAADVRDWTEAWNALATRRSALGALPEAEREALRLRFQERRAKVRRRLEHASLRLEVAQETPSDDVSEGVPGGS